MARAKTRKKAAKKPARKRPPRQPAGRTPAPTQAPAALRDPYLIADFGAIPSVPCPCGTSRRAFIREDNRVCSVHRVLISQDAKAHYHKVLTEIYYLLDGEGQIELDGVPQPVKQGMAVLIRPGTRHRALVGNTPMRILNIVVPTFDPKDEWFD